MAETNWLTGAAKSPYLPIIAGLVRGVVGIASGLGFSWALAVTGDQITMAATAVLAIGMLIWSGWQKITAIRASRRDEIAAARASAAATMEAGRPTPVTVDVTPGAAPNKAVLISPAEPAHVLPPASVEPSPAPVT